MKHDFFDLVLETAKTSGSLYTGTLKDRRALALFLDQNGLLDQAGFPRDQKETIVSRHSAWYPDPGTGEFLLNRVRLWLSAYKRPDSERLSILVAYGLDFLPKTCCTYERFIGSGRDISVKDSWQLLDYLLSVLAAEVPDMELSQTEQLLADMKTDLPRRHLSLFTEYLGFLSENSSGTRVYYRVPERSESCAEDAYPLSEFAAMAYCIFNERYWKDHGLLEKACHSRRMANLWAFLSLFFICGLRASDVIRIPRPSLPYADAEFREKILQNKVKDPGSFARDIQFQMKYRVFFPHKTSQSRDVPQLKLSIPVVLEQPAGIILSIAASYYPESEAGKPFLCCNTSFRDIRRFFGQPFADILGLKGFNVRRANKAYLQGIESSAAAGTAGAPRGYILAALARSHKGSLGALPETTDIYLKDAVFSGMDPAFVLFEMFQRGVFGFIPHLLMGICFGNRYQQLDIHSQTSLIQQAGISPSGIEALARAGERALGQAQLVIQSLLSRNADMRTVLSKVASGEAAAKQEKFLCALIAAGFPCSFPERRGCVGCPYEICTKAALHQLVSEFERLQSLSSGKDGWRAREIARAAILPVIQEFLSTMRLLYPDADLAPYHEILQGGMNHYDPFISPDS